MKYFRVTNLAKHQHYKNRRPPWIKLHAEVLDDYEFLRLPDASKAHAMLLWVVASKLDNRIPWDVAFLSRMLGATTEVNLEILLQHGFIEMLPEDASGALASRKQDAIAESDADVEEEGEKTDTSTTAREAEPKSEDVTAFARELVSAANAGMMGNPAIGETLNPIPFGHGSSVAAAQEMIAAGVTREFARSIVFEMSETFVPVNRNRQIKSLGYCTDRVIERWNSREAIAASRSASRPAAAARAGKRNGPREYDYTKPTNNAKDIKWQ